MDKRHRVFVAINLPEDVKRELARTMERIKERCPELPAKWIGKDNLHITLEFLGELTDVEIADACKAVAEVAKQHSSFSIDLNKILYGPPRLRSGQAPKFVWAEGEKSEELVELKEDLQEYLLENVRYRPEARGFAPHVTLARISEWAFRQIEPEERPEIAEDIDLTFTVESIEVMESVLKRAGPVYTVLESHQLK